MKSNIEQRDGVYQWVYELNLFTNPVILFVLWKIFGVICLGIWMFISLLSINDIGFGWYKFLETSKVFALFLVGMMIFTGLGYYLYAAFLGGKYCVLFIMDDRGILHAQLPSQYQKAQVIANLTMFVGALTGKAGVAGAGILAGTKASSYSQWSTVKSVIGLPHRHVIKVNSLLEKNQIYVETEDYSFVWQYILAHCPNAKIR